MNTKAFLPFVALTFLVMNGCGKQTQVPLPYYVIEDGGQDDNGVAIGKIVVHLKDGSTEPVILKNPFKRDNRASDKNNRGISVLWGRNSGILIIDWVRHDGKEIYPITERRKQFKRGLIAMYDSPAENGLPPGAPPADGENQADGENATGEVGEENVAGGDLAGGIPIKVQQIDKWNDVHSIPRNRQFSVSWPKLLSFWLLFLIWVRSVDWVNRDSQIHELGYGKWNLIMFLPFFLVVFFFVFPMFSPLPSFFPLGLGLLLVSYIASFSPYVVIHNKSVEGHQKIFTGDWFRYEMAQLANKVGIKINAERKSDYEKGVNVDLLADRDNQANLITARQSPGYLIVKELVANMVNKRVDRVIIEYTQQSVVERDQIDGVWHNGETRDRESGDVMLAVIKTLAGLDMNERRKKQVSRFGAGYNGTKYICPVTTQGVKTGERVVIDLLGGRREQFNTLEELGMRDKLAERWLDLLDTGKGLFILSAMPAGGLTTVTDVSLHQTDRLMRDFFAVEEEAHRERDIENIEVRTYNAAANETPASTLVPIIRKYPNVLVVRDFVDEKTATMLFSVCKPVSEIRDDRLVITNVHAKEAPEALLRMLQQKVPQRDFAELVTAVLNVRLVRKLCESCKVAYEPSGELLKKLGIPAGKVEQFYRTPKTEEVDKPCLQCTGIGYRGRSGLFELLVVNQEIRRLLVKQPKLELLRKAARAAHMRTLQEEGILLVARGVTSLQELQRVLSL